MRAAKIGFLVSIPKDEETYRLVVQSLGEIASQVKGIEEEFINLESYNIKDYRSTMSPDWWPQNHREDLLHLMRKVDKCDGLVCVFSDGEHPGSDLVRNFLCDIEFELKLKPINFIAIDSEKNVNEIIDLMRIHCIELGGIPLGKAVHSNPDESPELFVVDCFFRQRSYEGIKAMLNDLGWIANLGLPAKRH